MKKSFLIGFAALAGIFLLASGFDRYRLHPLKPLTEQSLPVFSLKDVAVTVSSKILNADESKQSFGHDLPSRGVSPLQVSIQNNTSNEYSISASAIDLPRVEAGKIAFKITKSAIPRSVAFKVASFFFWPLAIPSTIDGIRVFSHHKQIKKDILAKSLKDEVLAPYCTYTRVLFVPEKEMKDSFLVTVIDLETLQPTEIQVHVKQNIS